MIGIHIDTRGIKEVTEASTLKDDQERSGYDSYALCKVIWQWLNTSKRSVIMSCWKYGVTTPAGQVGTGISSCTEATHLCQPQCCQVQPVPRQRLSLSLQAPLPTCRRKKNFPWESWSPRSSWQDLVGMHYIDPGYDLAQQSARRK